MTDYLFLVENTTMVEAYADIFNIIASFFSSPLYLEIIKIIFLIGGFTTFLTMVFSMLKMDLSLQKQVAGPFKRGSILLGYLFIVTALFITTFTTDKVDMVIKTNQLPVYCTKLDRSNQPNINGNTPISGTVVGNVPWLWAWIMTSINDVGHSLTNFANTAFGSETANNTRANYVDFLQASSGILSTKLSDFSSDLQNTGLDTSLESALATIQRDCVLMPASKTSYLMSQDDLNNLVGTTGDIYRTLDNYILYGNLVSYKNPTDKQGVVKATNFQVDGVEPKNFLARINGDFLTCGRLWNGIKTSIQNLDNNQSAVCKKDLYKVLNGSNMSIFTGRTELPPAPETSNIILQAAMMNQVINNKSTLPAEVQYASGKSMAQIAINSAGAGFYMAKMMPYLQMTLRAILYAFIPFVFLVVILPGGIRVLASFTKTLLWVELWMPVAALLNMFIMTQISEKFAVAYQTQGLNAFNAYSVYSDAFMMAGVAGYLYAAIPAITWMILTGSAAMIGNIASGLISQVSSNFDSKTINEDMQRIQTSRIINQDRLKEGQSIVSMVESEQKIAIYQGASNAGSFVVMNDSEDRLFKASKGKELLSILENIGKEKAFKKDLLGLAAVSGGSFKQIVQTKENLLQMGIINENGELNHDVMKAIAITQGRESNIKLQTAAGIQSFIDDMERVLARVDKQLSTYGQNIATKDRIVAFLSTNEEGSSIINKINAGDKLSIVDGAKLVSIIGSYAKGYSGSSSDFYSSAMVNSGVFASALGSFRAGGEIVGMELHRMAYSTYRDKSYGKEFASYINMDNNDIFINLENSLKDSNLDASKRFVREATLGMLLTDSMQASLGMTDALTHMLVYKTLRENGCDQVEAEAKALSASAITLNNKYMVYSGGTGDINVYERADRFIQELQFYENMGIPLSWAVTVAEFVGIEKVRKMTVKQIEKKYADIQEKINKKTAKIKDSFNKSRPGKAWQQSKIKFSASSALFAEKHPYLTRSFGIASTTTKAAAAATLKGAKKTGYKIIKSPTKTGILILVASEGADAINFMIDNPSDKWIEAVQDKLEGGAEISKAIYNACIETNLNSVTINGQKIEVDKLRRIQSFGDKGLSLLSDISGATFLSDQMFGVGSNYAQFGTATDNIDKIRFNIFSSVYENGFYGVPGFKVGGVSEQHFITNYKIFMNRMDGDLIFEARYQDPKFAQTMEDLKVYSEDLHLLSVISEDKRISLLGYSGISSAESLELMSMSKEEYINFTSTSRGKEVFAYNFLSSGIITNERDLKAKIDQLNKNWGLDGEHKITLDTILDTALHSEGLLVEQMGNDPNKVRLSKHNNFTRTIVDLVSSGNEKAALLLDRAMEETTLAAEGFYDNSPQAKNVASSYFSILSQMINTANETDLESAIKQQKALLDERFEEIDEVQAKIYGETGTNFIGKLANDFKEFTDSRITASKLNRDGYDGVSFILSYKATDASSTTDRLFDRFSSAVTGIFSSQEPSSDKTNKDNNYKGIMTD